MFTINNTKTFKDSVHGYIDIPKCFVESLIDNEYFQRLRNIEQTGMRILYPNAKHDRFSHSLGVFHLGQRAVDDLLENFSKDQYWNIESDNQSVLFWAKNKILFLIACLLHDIGHAPFSHALESEVLHNSKKPIDNTKKNKKTKFNDTDDGDYITNKLQNIILESEKSYMQLKYNETFDNLAFNISNVAAHEQLGALLVLDSFFEKQIANIFNNLHNNGFPRPDGESIIYAEHYDDRIIIDKVDMNDEKSKIIFKDDLCFIARMIMGLKYDDWHPERQIRNCFIELLNGENFDVDKLDYIVRDTQMSGINNISVDVDRLLNSLCIVTKTKHFNKTNMNYANLPQMTVLDVKNYNKDDSIHIDGEFQGQFVIKKGAQINIRKNSKIEFVSGIGGNSVKIHYPDASIARFSVDTRVYQDSEMVLPDEDEESENKIILLRGKGGKKQFNVFIKNATLLNDFRFYADEDIRLGVRERCNITIIGEFYSERSIRLFKAENLNGTISEIEVLADSFKYDFTIEKVPNKNSYNTFSIGFKKNAINVIANVMDARNYLYLWIYAHHKVIYYANFLIPVLARELFPKNKTNEFPNWSLDFNNIKYLDDAYLWTVIKYQYCQKNWNKTPKEKELKILLDELFTRNYKTSLYKSLAEYDLFFEKYSIDIKSKLKEYISTKLIENSRMPKIECGFKNNKPMHNVGYFKNGEINKINEIIKTVLTDKYGLAITPEESGKVEIKELVYVSADYKMKQMETLKTFVDMKEDIVSISQIPLLEAQTKKYEQNGTNPYYYLYYQTKNKNMRAGDNEIIKEAIKTYFDNIVVSKIQK